MASSVFQSGFQFLERRLRSPGPTPTIQPDLNLYIVPPMSPTGSTFHASPGRTDLMIRPTGTEHEGGCVQQIEVGSALQSFPTISSRQILERNISSEEIVLDAGSGNSAKNSEVCTYCNQIHTSRQHCADVEVAKLEAERSTFQKRIEEIQVQYDQQAESERCWNEKVRIAVSQQLQAVSKRVQGLERELKDRQKSLAGVLHENTQLRDEILSLNSTVASLQKISRAHESCARTIQSLNVIVAELRQEHESYVTLNPGKPEPDAQSNAVCGSYVNGSATPGQLNDALTKVKSSVKTFQKAFVQAINLQGDCASIVDLLYPDVLFARPNHPRIFAAKAIIYEALFAGFENESFNTCLGVTKFIDCNVRQMKFYEYYLSEQGRSNDTGGTEDPQFEAFCKMKVALLWEKFNLACEGMNMAQLEKLGGVDLVSGFRVAARNVWLLHKLAFSFDPPASIFRVEQGAQVDLAYMNLVVELDEHRRFVSKVGFMIAPGFRVGKTVLSCEVYLAAGAT